MKVFPSSHLEAENPFGLVFQNKAEFKNQDDSEFLISDFPDLRISAASLTSTASTTLVASMTFTASFHQKNTDPDDISTFSVGGPPMLLFWKTG